MGRIYYRSYTSLSLRYIAPISWCYKLFLMYSTQTSGSTTWWLVIVFHGSATSQKLPMTYHPWGYASIYLNQCQRSKIPCVRDCTGSHNPSNPYKDGGAIPESSEPSNPTLSVDRRLVPIERNFGKGHSIAYWTTLIWWTNRTISIHISNRYDADNLCVHTLWSLCTIKNCKYSFNIT